MDPPLPRSAVGLRRADFRCDHPLPVSPDFSIATQACVAMPHVTRTSGCPGPGPPRKARDLSPRCLARVWALRLCAWGYAEPSCSRRSAPGGCPLGSCGWSGSAHPSRSRTRRAGPAPWGDRRERDGCDLALGGRVLGRVERNQQSVPVESDHPARGAGTIGFVTERSSGGGAGAPPPGR